MTNLNTDRSFFTIVCEHGADVESQPTSMSMTRSDLDDEVQAGGYTDIKVVLESNPVEGWCRDITEDVISGSSRRNHTPYSGPNAEHRIDGALAGVGSHGPFGGRA